MKHYLSIFLCLLFSLFTRAQVGGSTVYNFLQQAPNWRITALGETNITIADYDPGVQLANPAALNPLMHRHVQFSTTVDPGGVNRGNLNYVHDFGRRGTYGFGLQYIAYGKIAETDASGIETGRTQNPGEMAIYGGGSYRFGKIFSVGANLRVIYSALGPFQSFGVTGDLAAMVNDTAHRIIATIAAKNIGGELAPYLPGKRQPVPFNLQAGISVGFKGFPLRFHFTFHDLNRWNLRYDNPADNTSNELLGDTTKSKSNNHFADEFFRHLVVGIECNIKKVVFIDAGYNHQRRMEYVQSTRRSVAGFTFGIGVHVKQIAVGIALSPMPLKQTQAQFTLVVNSAGFTKKASRGK
ncbi:MAG: type IX secretion system protein PorQ [Chitinophagales bacterium]